MVFEPRFELYAITDQKSSLGRSDEEVARGLIQGGCTCLQYRAKRVCAKEQWETAFRLCRLAKAAGVFFVVNDRIDLALDCGADGVHLGQDDIPMPAARRLAGRRLCIGRSTHSLEQAKAAATQGPDYIAFGPLYASSTKEHNLPPLGAAALEEVLNVVEVPVVAIGGIKFNHLEELARRRAAHVAVVSALTGAMNIASETRRYLLAWRQAKGNCPAAS